ncbi:glycosyltransferase involved in cell wall biosynthesis [Pedobacter sp. W3I1]|uniref:glycosyltransferase n=1 Tax=Pedobacter sp. W3I1 TaxID=3042291 RepID=UPI00278A11CE|nr:glycosyltransferase [Pedobacter sp. W3I1]MDQ0637094.1 glycosyltransferase involved in cell wall biosynthesis [Pedobacter sp. W3I1]
MVKRKQITLIYSYDDNWIGGTYYILNIIKALLTLKDEDKPKILVLHNLKSSIKPILDIEYPFIEFKVVDLQLSLPKKVINKLFYYLNGKSIFNMVLPNDIGPNVYPLSYNVSDANIKNGFYWIADLQEYFLPEFFLKLDVRNRKNVHKQLVKNQSRIVFSSKTAADEFDTFYPNNKNEKYILNFASFIDETYKEINLQSLLNKFKIDKPFFIVSNQFWVHKNHMVVLEALKILQNEGDLPFKIIFTGKESDYRNPGYFGELKKYIKDNNLEKYVEFLGFIDRNEQLKLMANSIAIIQPSLFEGWSTVVEDAKVINQHIIVSDIKLHREQINLNCSFFDPYNAEDLAKVINRVLTSDLEPIKIDYQFFQKKFGGDFNKLFK